MQQQAYAPGCAMPFDNTDERMSTLRAEFKCSPHFHVKTSEAEFVYCHIPKNACTSFRNLVRGTSEHKTRVSEHKSRMKFMKKYHRLRGKGTVSKYGQIVFVYRDPLKRAVSGFRHKFIMMAGQMDIFLNFKRITGGEPHEATFDDFVRYYLTGDLRKVDAHFRTQQSKLLPVRYTHAIPMGSLYPEMSDIIGSELAQTYFGKKSNSSGGNEYDEAANDIPVRDLYKRWQYTGEIPSYKSLLTNELRETLSHIYADDCAMISRIEAD